MTNLGRAAGQRLGGLVLALCCFVIAASGASRGVAAPSATDLRALVFLAATISRRRRPSRWARSISSVAGNECSHASLRSAGEYQWKRD
jgi:hypothetical protein